MPLDFTLWAFKFIRAQIMRNGMLTDLMRDDRSITVFAASRRQQTSA